MIPLNRIVEYLVVFVLVLLISTILASFLGAGPLAFPAALTHALFDSPLDILFYATPLIFSGLAVAIAGQAGLLNIGVEGQLLLGAFLAGVVGHGYGLPFKLPIALHWAFLLVISIVLPALVATFCGWAKAKYDVHEVLTTLFSYFVILSALNYLVNLPSIRDPHSTQTRPILEGLRLEPWINGGRLGWEFVWALSCVLLTWFFLYKTAIGLRVRGAGHNPNVHRKLGFPVSKIYTLSMFLSGAVASLAGIQRVLGEDYRYIDGFSPGYGFIGLGIAFAARNRPQDVFVISCIFAFLQKAGASLSSTISTSKQFFNFIQVLLLVSLVLVAKVKWIRK